MRGYLSLIQLNPQGPRNDVTPLFADYEAFRALIRDLLEPFEQSTFDYVAGIDALGFVLGTAAAFTARKGLVAIRKSGKVPGPSLSVDFVDYTGRRRTLELRKGAVNPGARILLVDDWIETGAQVQAAVRLIESQGGVVIGIAAIHMDDCAITRWLRERYQCHTVSLGT